MATQYDNLLAKLRYIKMFRERGDADIADAAEGELPRVALPKGPLVPVYLTFDGGQIATRLVARIEIDGRPFDVYAPTLPDC